MWMGCSRSPQACVRCCEWVWPPPSLEDLVSLWINKDIIKAWVYSDRSTRDSTALKKTKTKNKKPYHWGLVQTNSIKKPLYYKKEKYAQDNGVYVSFFLLSGKSVWHNAYIFEGIHIATRLQKVFRLETSLNACSSFWATPLSRGLWEMGRAQQRGHSLPPSLWWLRFTVFALRFSFTHTETHEDKEMPWTVGVSSVQNLLPLLCLNYSWYTQLA